MNTAIGIAFAHCVLDLLVTKPVGEAAVSYGLIAAILVLGGGGYVLDLWLDTSPWLLIGGLLAGLSIGFYTLRRLITSQ
jgi:F0F1-type ATP synthase assembly protein I